MRPILLDADAFRFLRALDLLSVLEGLARATRAGITEYVARHELSLLSSDIQGLEARGVLTIYPLVKGTAEQQRYREYQRQLREGKFPRPVDKGECEAVAWSVTRPAEERPVFVTCDAGATWFAAREHVPATDLLGLTIAAVRAGVLSREDLAVRLSPWDSPAQQVGRPTGYAGFDLAFEQRWRDEVALFE